VGALGNARANTRSGVNVTNDSTEGKHLFGFLLDTNVRSWLSYLPNKRSEVGCGHHPPTMSPTKPLGVEKQRYVR
jgi:hypothetical protein